MFVHGVAGRPCAVNKFHKGPFLRSGHGIMPWLQGEKKDGAFHCAGRKSGNWVEKADDHAETRHLNIRRGKGRRDRCVLGTGRKIIARMGATNKEPPVHRHNGRITSGKQGRRRGKKSNQRVAGKYWVHD